MEWSELGQAWLAQLGEGRPDAEPPDAEPEEQWEDWPEDAPDAPPEAPPSGPARGDAGRIRSGQIRSGVALASLALGALLVVGLGASPGEPVEPQGGHCQPLLPPLHRHGVTARPAAHPVATSWKCV